jgi:hypothetical protein
MLFGRFLNQTPDLALIYLSLFTLNLEVLLYITTLLVKQTEIPYDFFILDIWR